MNIEANKVVSIAYTLKNAEGEVLDTADEKEPFDYMHGTAMIVPGLEKALEGKAAGDTVSVTLAPDDAYGQRDERLIRNVPIRRFAGVKLQAGRRYTMTADGHAQHVLVTALRGDYATIDPNHPLAGVTLQFEVKVLAVRDATPDELDHGHVHGEGHEH